MEEIERNLARIRRVVDAEISRGMLEPVHIADGPSILRHNDRPVLNRESDNRQGLREGPHREYAAGLEAQGNLGHETVDHLNVDQALLGDQQNLPSRVREPEATREIAVIEPSIWTKLQSLLGFK